MSTRFPVAFHEVLRTYAALDDRTRERLARVRRLDGNTLYHRPDPKELAAAIEETDAARREAWGSDFRRVSDRLYASTIRASGRLVPWSQAQQAADLEVQAVLVAILFRDLLSSESFAALTRAWREIGLPVPTPKRRRAA